MAKITAILFDVIGTTVLEKDPDAINNCFISAFNQHGIRLDKALIKEVRGKDKRDAIKEILEKNGGSQAMHQLIFDSFVKNVASRMDNFYENPALPGLVKHLRSNGVKVGVGSGLPEVVFQLLFNALRWERHAFDFVSTFEKFREGRPAPHMINSMCEQLNIGKANFLKVGDTVADIEEGLNAGVQTAVLLSGTQPREMLLASRPTKVLISLEDLIGFLQ